VSGQVPFIHPAPHLQVALRHPTEHVRTDTIPQEDYWCGQLPDGTHTRRLRRGKLCAAILVGYGGSHLDESHQQESPSGVPLEGNLPCLVDGRRTSADKLCPAQWDAGETELGCVRLTTTKSKMPRIGDVDICFINCDVSHQCLNNPLHVAVS
jgi:hypothetical protein